MKKIKEITKRWGTEGMRWPFLYDPVSKKPSVTLLFFYISYIVACITVFISSSMLIINKDYLTATYMPILMLFSGFVFYRLRRLDSIKINLRDQSIDLGGSDGGEY